MVTMENVRISSLERGEVKIPQHDEVIIGFRGVIPAKEILAELDDALLGKARFKVTIERLS